MRNIVFEHCLRILQNKHSYSVLSSDEGKISTFQNVVAEET
jgi:hypothetical protein